MERVLGVPRPRVSPCIRDLGVAHPFLAVTALVPDDTPPPSDISGLWMGKS